MAELLSDRQLLAELLEEREKRRKSRKLYSYFPDKGPLRRELYKKHMLGFKAMAANKHVWMMAGNRTGKTESWLLFAITCAMTGRYPDWWMGKKWTRPVKVWLAGKSGTTTRDILQFKLLGPPNERGTGLIPAEDIVNTTAKSGIGEAVDTLYVRHVSGGTSILQFKSYDQGRKAFEGQEQDIIGLDEEPPQDVYEEATVRTMTCSGVIWASFTPLEGITELIANEFPEGIIEEGKTPGGKFVVSMTWDDVPHLTEQMKEDLWSSIAPHLRDARKKGIPAVGSGLIYPVSPDDYLCDPFPIPEDWPKLYALDVGWNKTAATFGAFDPNTGCCYVYSEHYQGQGQPAIHASAIKSRGQWIPGVIDPASRGRSQVDGRRLIDEYKSEGLDLTFAKNAREAGILKAWQALTTGKLKIFRNLHHIFVEMRLYRRDEDGQVIKSNDHLMDCMRYLVMAGRGKARLSPSYAASKAAKPQNLVYGGMSGAWEGV